MQAKCAALAAMVSMAAACGGREDSEATPRTTSREGGEQRQVVLFLGTSLTAGYGLDPAQAFPALIQEKIDAAGLGFRVVNAGVSGETSAGALRRLEWILDRERPAVLVIETGANDGLRGQDPDSLKANLAAIIDRAREVDPPPQIVLLAMEALPNLGRDYVTRFRNAYRDVARDKDVPLIPFFLVEVAGVDSLNQVDGIHPTASGQALAAERVWEGLERVLKMKD